MLTINYVFTGPFQQSDEDLGLIVDANGTPILRAANEMLAFGFVEFLNNLMDKTDIAEIEFDFGIDGEIIEDDVA